MTIFDFITGEDFKSSLESDYQELSSAMEVSAWKAVHVLSGSIIEAMLVDYLVASDYQGRKSLDQLLNMGLNDLIKECVRLKILSERTEQISHVIRSYRNLIHPGKMVRLQESVDEDSARVAFALVKIIVKEVSAKRRENYGYTAEQIVAKIESDSSTFAIAGHLLKDTNEHEKKRLLLDIIPQRYIYYTGLDEPIGITLTSLSTCYRLVYKSVVDETRELVAQALVKIIKEESEKIANTYEDAFFTAEDLKHFSEEGRIIVKQHIFSRLKRKVSTYLLETLAGIEEFLNEEDIEEVMSILLRSYIINDEYEYTRDIQNFINKLYVHEGFKYSDEIERSIRILIQLYSVRNLEEHAHKLSRLLSEISHPF